jgi:hypothetical protein
MRYVSNVASPGLQWRKRDLMLRGQRLGNRGTEVRLELLRRVGTSRFRARSGEKLALGERLFFGDSSNRVCLLGTLTGTVTWVGEQGNLEVTFEYRDEVVDQMLAALEE